MRYIHVFNKFQTMVDARATAASATSSSSSSKVDHRGTFGSDVPAISEAAQARFA